MEVSKKMYDELQKVIDNVGHTGLKDLREKFFNDELDYEDMLDVVGGDDVTDDWELELDDSGDEIIWSAWFKNEGFAFQCALLLLGETTIDDVKSLYPPKEEPESEFAERVNSELSNRDALIRLKELYKEIKEHSQNQSVRVAEVEKILNIQ